MMKLTEREAIQVVKGVISTDMVYIHPVEERYIAHVYTSLISEETNEDTLHDYFMEELDSILDYIFSVWNRKYEEMYGPYEQYEEVIRDFVINDISVEFHSIH